MSVEEVRLLFSIPDQKKDDQLRDLAILVLLYETGARVQELIDLVPSDIRFSSVVTAELHGKGNTTRLVPVNADAAAIVRNYIHRCNRRNADEPLFVNRKGEKLTRAGIQSVSYTHLFSLFNIFPADEDAILNFFIMSARLKIVSNIYSLKRVAAFSFVGAFAFIEER